MISMILYRALHSFISLDRSAIIF